MTRYTVRIPYPAELIVRGVEANDSEDAIDAAADNVPGLCATCSQHYDLALDADWGNATAEVES